MKLRQERNFVLYNNMRNEFMSILRGVSIGSTALKIMSIPIGIVNAKLLSTVIASATSGDYLGVIKSGSIIIGLLIFIKIFEIITQNQYQKAKSNAVHKCKMVVYKQYLSRPLRYLYNISAGEVNVILNDDFRTITEKITESYATLISGITTIIAYFAFLCFQSPLIACILVLISVLQIIPPLFSKNLYEKYDVEDKEMEKQVTNCVSEFYCGFATIKMYNLKDWCLDRLKKLHKKWWSIANRLQATYQAESAINSAVTNALTYGTYAIIGVLILYKIVDVNVGIEAIALSGGLYAAVKGCFKTITVFILSKNAENRMMSFWNELDEEKQLISLTDTIEYNDVSCVLDDQSIFNKLNLSIRLNGITIIKGENGAGKTTLMKLALGMLDCQEGNICIGGLSPNQMSYQNYPKNIFYLPQDDAVYPLSSIELYSMLLEDDSLKQADIILQRFGITQELFEKKISDLSGGERKKVFLSLAFSIEPKLLVMDEPTNSLDAESRDELLYLLRNRSGNTIIITHDDKLMTIASTTYEVMKGGVVSEKHN